MRRVTIPPERSHGDRVTFDRDETHHLVRVLRLRAGDTVLASDGTGRELTVRLDSVGDPATGVVLGVADGRGESALAITLLQGIPKGDTLETIVRAATELGVARVWPVIAERTIVRLEPHRWRDRSRRWQRVAREATKQCRRAVIPEVEPPRPLDEWLDALETPAEDELRLCLWEEEAPPLRDVLSGARGSAPGDARRVARALVLIGPEGGLAAREVDGARARGFVVASLGHRILRTETAGPAVIAVLQWTLGDLGAP